MLNVRLMPGSSSEMVSSSETSTSISDETEDSSSSTIGAARAFRLRAAGAFRAPPVGVALVALDAVGFARPPLARGLELEEMCTLATLASSEDSCSSSLVASSSSKSIGFVAAPRFAPRLIWTSSL